MDETSLSLLERVQRQADEESWNRLVQVYAPLLRRWLNYCNVQNSDCEDLLQEVLSVVVSELPSFRHNRQTGAFRNWLRTILVHRIRDFWRSRQRRPIATGSSDFVKHLDELADNSSELSSIWNREHDEHVVERLMALIQTRVASATWEAFRLQMIDGLSASEVARKLDMRIDSAYAAKSRVLHMLRREADGLVD